MKKTDLKHYENLCDIQIRFKVCDSVRFGRSQSIISLSFCNFFSVEISNII